ncbi:MAG: DUF1638 domain-containing protein [Acidimicrobiales bacterium]|jgi:hypothetical protein
MATTIIACGALGPSIREIVERRRWPVQVQLLSSLLHNRPREIAPRVEEMAQRLLDEGHQVVLAYADCGTYGALDDVCERLHLGRLAGLHCYDVFAGASRVATLFADEPGTYILTDFLVRSFRSSVIAELGLDRHPELWSDYFAHYRRVVWLAQARDGELEREAREVAAMFNLPLEVLDVATGSLEVELERLLDGLVGVSADGAGRC